MNAPFRTSPSFSLLSAFLYSVGCFLIMILLQMIGLLVVSWWYFDGHFSELTNLIQLGSYNGITVAYSVFFTAITFSILAVLSILPKTKTLSQTLSFLGIRWFNIKELGFGLLLLLIFLLISEGLTYYLDKNPMAFIDGLLDASSLYVMMFAVVIVAPIYEELIFRGVLFGVLNHTKTDKLTKNTPIFLGMSSQNIIANIISSLIFALVHFQYDSYGLLMIFIIALLFCYIRIHYGLLLAMVLHIANNGIAMWVYLVV